MFRSSRKSCCGCCPGDSLLSQESSPDEDRGRAAATSGTFQHRSARAAREGDRGVAPIGARAGARQTVAAARRERAGADRDLRSRDGGRRAEPPHRAGRRMAARQFLSDRRANPRDPAAAAALLQPRTAATGERPGRRLSPRVWHRPGTDRARRWARRCRQPQRLHRFLSVGRRRSSWANCGRCR